MTQPEFEFARGIARPSRLALVAALWFAFVLALASGPAQARGVDGVAELGYWVDESGDVSVEAVAGGRAPGLRWTPTGSPLLNGYSDAAVWLRLVPAAIDGPQDASIRIGAPYLDLVEVYRPTAAGGYERVRLGDRVPVSEWERPERMFHAVWNAAQREAAAGRPVYIRVQSSSSLAISVDVPTEREWVRLSQRDQFAGGIYLGMIVLLVLWSVVQVLLFRDPLAAIFIAYLLISSSATLLLSGLLNTSFPAGIGSRHTWSSWLILLTTTSALLLHGRLVKDLGNRRAPLVVIGLGLAFSGLNIGLFSFGLERQALESNATSVVLIMGLLLPAVMLGSLRSRDVLERIGAGAYVLLGTFVVVSTLPVVGLGKVLGFAYSYYVPALHTFVTALTVASLMLVRRLKLQDDLTASRQQAAAAQAQAEQAGQQRDEKERFLSMLAHELRTPLSVVRMVLESPPPAAEGSPAGAGAEPERAGARRLEQARRAVEDMNQVISRTLLTDRVERGDLSINPQRIDLRELCLLLASDHPEGERVALHASEDPVMLESDPFLVRTIVANLLDNALKYSPAGATVEVHLHAGPAATTLRVFNPPGAAGMPDPQRVFDKYYRSPGAHKQTGSGLGLYLVAGLARRIGATVREVSEPSGAAAGRVGFEVRWGHALEENARP